VRALIRNASAPPVDPRIETFAIDLPDMIDTRAFDAADVVIHAAYGTRGGRGDTMRRTNEQGTMRVIDAARAAGVRRLIFVSSLAAGPDAQSYYGRSKQELEDRLDAAHDLVIRPGLVLAADGGLAQRLWRSIVTLHVAPLIAGGRQIVQTLHIDDLCAAFQRAIELDLKGVLAVAEADGIPMHDFLAALASAAHARYLAVPVPARATILALQVLEAVGVRLPVAADNLRGLLAMRHVDVSADASRLGLRIRAARDSIADLAPAFMAGARRTS